MKYIVYILFIVSLIFGNEELNTYINNKDLQYQIIKDEKNEKFIIDLLYDENRIIIFTKFQDKENYKKTLDEKLYFCEYYRCSTIMAKVKNNNLYIISGIPNVDNSSYQTIYKFENYSNINSRLLSIEKRYINIDDDSLVDNYIFKPQKNIPKLKNFNDKQFYDTYLDKNYYNFKNVNGLIKRKVGGVLNGKS